jgi:pyridoxamine 5'-phosphate oxidase
MYQLSDHIRRLRHEFRHEALDEKNVDADPALQFEQWLQQAVDAGLNEPQAMVLSTALRRPSSRVVYLREFRDHQYWFYTNYDSKKGNEMIANPFVALNFYWADLHRQVRIEGIVRKATEKESDDYFNSRPYESKIGAWASEQSADLQSRKKLEEKVEELKKKFSPENITRPPQWGGYVVAADYYEFWQGRESRLHDRIVYNPVGKAWKISRVAP